jgi:hypothetical protein
MRATPQWTVWVLILALQVGTFAALAPPVWAAAVKSPGAWDPPTCAHIAAVLALLALPFVGRFVFGVPHRVQGAFTWRLLVVGALGSVLAFGAAVAVIRTRQGLARLVRDRSKTTAELVDDYVRARKQLVVLGSLLAMLIALAVMGAGGLRNAIVARETARAAEQAAVAAAAEDGSALQAEAARAAALATSRANRFGVELVWAYGLYYSFALVLIYVPAHVAATATGEALRDRLHPAPLPGDADYDPKKKAHDAMTERLLLNKSPITALRPVTVVLIPLASSLASTLLGGVKLGG